MKFVYGKNDWADINRGQENCYLLTNGLGGYSSLTMVGSVARNDQALLMICTKAPNVRYHMVTRMDELIQIGDKNITLSSQEHVSYARSLNGFRYISRFEFDHIPKWTYQVEGIEINKSIVMRHGENTIGIQYEIENRMDTQIELSVTPQLQFTAKGDVMAEYQEFSFTDTSIQSNNLNLFYQTNAKVEAYDTEYVQDLFYEHDARDGRDSIGRTANNHRLSFQVLPHQEAVFYVIYSTNQINITFDHMISDEEARQTMLATQSGLKDELGLQLVKSADQFIVDRESTGGKSIMAGYPFFADWGRDTMISLVGCCISTRRFDDAKNIFRTFIKYCKKGLMPNMFPEGENDPLYNTVDASLLFISAVYEYYLESKDIEFVIEAYPTMIEILEYYQKGTDFHINMDEDGLIQAGSGLEQVTWMDVRFGEILPTPRHGKPVEINAYWYNSLMILDCFSKLLAREDEQYVRLAEKVKKSFCESFWNEKQGCLKDVVSGEKGDNQIRCNQIWAVSLPFTMLSAKQEKMVVDKVFEKLYTPYGLRTLDIEDKDFKPKYGGTHFKRDMAYHQGTVWPFPLGGYYLAYLKVNNYSTKAVTKVKQQLSVFEACMREGCIGQIAEIYDGENPTKSEGCFAQAWSVSEIMRIFALLERVKSK